MSHSGKKDCDRKKRCCYKRQTVLPKRGYAHVFFSSIDPQFVSIGPGTSRNVVEFNQTPITKNVTHPFDGDPSKLRINLGGIYTCSWILNTVAIAGTGGYYLSQGAFALQINDEVLPDRPQHYGGYALPIEANPNVVRPQLVGQDLVRLKTGDIVQLRLVKAFPDPTIIDEGLVVNLTQSFQGQSNPNFNCVGADLILERIDS